MSISAPRKASIKPADSGAPAERPLAGRHAVVTGASRGIGAAIARELARLGADITLIARNRAALAETARALGTHAARVCDIAADVTDEAETARALADAAAAMGAPSILVNNAGGAESAPFAKTDPALWRRMIELNLTSAYLCTRAAAPAMIGSGWGRIVNVASTAGLKGYGYVSAYVAAKHGLVGLTRALAVEFARTGVTVNAVCPGYTDTPMLDAAIKTISAKTKRSADEARAGLAATNPMGRLITPEEVAAAVGYLCLPAAASVTGETLAIDGGEVA
jgi:NAD(P)-dependent dehydrogenase (short-subunit alcohol dehydrogenase family)